MAFFLSLFFFLLKGNDHLHAYYNLSGYAPAKLSPKSEQASLGSVKNSQTQIRKSASSGAEDDAISAIEEMEDDDDFTPSRKYVEISNYFLTLFYNQVSGSFNQYRKDRLPFCKHFSYTSSYQYIIYRVIRI